MKKTYLFAALAALCLAACNENKTDSAPAETTAAVTTAADTASDTTAPAENNASGTEQTTAEETAPVTTVTVKKVTPKQAAELDLATIAGEWRYNETKNGKTNQIGEFIINADGSFFHYIVENDEIQDMTGTGKITAEDGKYVFRYDDGKDLLSAKPSEKDPLNALTESEQRGLVRCVEDAMQYERSYTPVTELPKEKTGTIGVELISGGYWYYGEMSCWTFSGSGLNGTFTYQNSLSAEKTADSEVQGKVVVEQGEDNAGKLQYYYNCYAESGDLLASLEAESLNGKDSKQDKTITAAYLVSAAQENAEMRWSETKQESEKPDDAAQEGEAEAGAAQEGEAEAGAAQEGAEGE
ncbi:MAG: hypothetical protein IK130_07745 [Oscillospiraceae bacterium]|nr:hypothetical protein [Oscillospiraceae bacterium]